MFDQHLGPEENKLDCCFPGMPGVRHHILTRSVVETKGQNMKVNGKRFNNSEITEISTHALCSLRPSSHP